jgi:hypothetical protein
MQLARQRALMLIEISERSPPEFRARLEAMQCGCVSPLLTSNFLVRRRMKATTDALERIERRARAPQGQRVGTRAKERGRSSHSVDFGTLSLAGVIWSCRLRMVSPLWGGLRRGLLQLGGRARQIVRSRLAGSMSETRECPMVEQISVSAAEAAILTESELNSDGCAHLRRPYNGSWVVDYQEVLPVKDRVRRSRITDAGRAALTENYPKGIDAATV